MVAAVVATQLLLQADVVVSLLQSPQVHLGEVLDSHSAGLIEIQARLHPAGNDRHRAGIVAALHQHGGPAGVGPLAILPGPRLGEAAVEGEGVVGMAMRGQEHGVAVGLGLGVEGLRRPGDKGVDVALRPRDRLAGLIARPRGDRDARRGAHHLAGDAGLMAQPSAQPAVQLAERDAGFGNLDLDVVAPVVGIGRGWAGRQGLGLKLR